MTSAIVGSKVIVRGNDFVKQDLSASIVTIDDEYNPDDPMGLIWWRGGAAAITDLYFKHLKETE